MSFPLFSAVTYLNSGLSNVHMMMNCPLMVDIYYVTFLIDYFKKSLVLCNFAANI